MHAWAVRGPGRLAPPRRGKTALVARAPSRPSPLRPISRAGEGPHDHGALGVVSRHGVTRRFWPCPSTGPETTAPGRPLPPPAPHLRLAADASASPRSASRSRPPASRHARSSRTSGTPARPGRGAANGYNLERLAQLEEDVDLVLARARAHDELEHPPRRIAQVRAEGIFLVPREGADADPEGPTSAMSSSGPIVSDAWSSATTSSSPVGYTLRTDSRCSAGTKRMVRGRWRS